MNQALTKLRKYPAWSCFAFGLILVFAAITRFYFLDNKPAHHDETINGWFVMQMWKNGFFRYDPSNYHGPLLFYLFQLAEVFFGKGIVTLRVVTTAFSFLTIAYLLWKALKGQWTFYISAIIFLLSPGSIFFSRSAIHEAPFVFFQVLTFFGFLEFAKQNYRKGIPLLIYGLVGCITLKETFAVTLFSGLLAIVVFNFRNLVPSLKQIKLQIAEQGLNSYLEKHLVIGVFATFLLFTGFFQNSNGALDLFKAFLPWLKTGSHGAGHEKSFFYWLNLLGKYEYATLLAVMITGAGLFLKNKLIRTVCFFALVQGLIYSAIPYKTPWCLISLQWPFVIAVALVLQYLLEQKKNAVAYGISALLVVLALFQIKFVNSLNYQDPIDAKHPYVYVQTSYDTKNFLNLVLNEFAKKPHLSRSRVVVGTAETWPFPWLFGEFEGLEFANKSTPYKDGAIVMIYDLDRAAEIESKLTEAYWRFEILVRDARNKAVVYLRKAEFTNTEPFESTSVDVKP